MAKIKAPSGHNKAKKNSKYGPFKKKDLKTIRNSTLYHIGRGVNRKGALQSAIEDFTQEWTDQFTKAPIEKYCVTPDVGHKVYKKVNGMVSDKLFSY